MMTKFLDDLYYISRVKGTFCKQIRMKDYVENAFNILAWQTDYTISHTSSLFYCNQEYQGITVA
jgi:hypothetical protein